MNDEYSENVSLSVFSVNSVVKNKNHGARYTAIPEWVSITM